MGDFIDEKLVEQDRRDRYGFGSSGYGVGLKTSGGVGLSAGGVRATGAGDDALQALFDAHQPASLPEYLPLADNSSNPPLVSKAPPSAPGFWSGLANTVLSGAATTVVGGSHGLMTPAELATWKQAHPNAAFGEMPTVQYQVNVNDMSMTRVIGSTPSAADSLLDIFSLQTRPVGQALGRFFGGWSTASDGSLSSEIRSQGAYDAGANSLSVPAALLMTGAPGLRFGEGTAAKVTAVRSGEFSIVDWGGYPVTVPKPQGPFRLIEGAEYDAARSAANSANNKIRQEQGLVGQPVDIHEIQPMKFDGSPTDPANKVILPRAVHRQQVTPWWNQLQRDLTGR